MEKLERRAADAERRADVAEEKVKNLEDKLGKLRREDWHKTERVRDLTMANAKLWDEIFILKKKCAENNSPAGDVAPITKQEKSMTTGTTSTTTTATVKPETDSSPGASHVEKNDQITLKLHRGSSQETTIGPNNCVKFTGRYGSTTVAAPKALVQEGMKAVYEVTLKRKGGDYVFIGWATPEFKQIFAKRAEGIVGVGPHRWVQYLIDPWDFLVSPPLT